ncbi:phosphotransferase [Paenibacillus doosanensis]|uniref:Homoserine kinase n=1 Tax=Paenibacillus konkukensis TaxID=2020716 RepID=A0ABY4RXN0_9BACL|nr:MULTISPECIES: phosphotransferase [Paenibacillus]MCS7459357.1 phosphotransferase [Paenibacillus doosanensis]UQZ87150.1 Homoserine kinase [Paenibacillus konkukensis]
MTSELDLLINELLAHYFEDGQWRTEAKESGVNNTTRFVYRASGTYVLRIYDNHTDMNKIVYETAVLQQLQRVKLSYQVPKPVATMKGASYAVAASGKVAVLFEYIEGERAELASLIHAEAVGRAMGELTEALAKVQVDMEAAYEPYYELYEVHPLVTRDKLDNWLEEMAEGPLYAEIRLLRDAIDRLLDDITSLCRLPVQLTHSDIVASNVLVASDRVTGILDFEFVTPDLRAMDAAVYMCELIRFYPEEGMELAQAFIAGYGQSVRLEDDEIDTLPQLILLRSMVLVIHFLGRCWDGIDAEQGIDRYIISFAQVTVWLEQHEEELLGLLRKQWEVS